MTAIIRPIQPDDLVHLVELCRLHAQHEGLPFSEDRQTERWHHAFFGTPPQAFGWVVARGERLVGYMTAVIEFATWPAQAMVYMDCLFLRDDERRAGLGSRLICTLGEFARERQIAVIEWQTPPHNEIGLSFYARIGASSLPKLRFSLAVADISPPTPEGKQS